MAQVQWCDDTTAKRERVHFSGCLRPDRRIEMGQVIQGRPAGGVSVQVQVPLPEGSCFEDLPPTQRNAIGDAARVLALDKA
jgi:hypothetical protein